MSSITWQAPWTLRFASPIASNFLLLHDNQACYLWFKISTVPYCSIHSFPIITLWTQQVGFVQV